MVATEVDLGQPGYCGGYSCWLRTKKVAIVATGVG